ATKVTLSNSWSKVRSQSAFVWIFGTLAICGGDFAYMLGSQNAPIAHIDLIDYSWPIMLVVFLSFLPSEKFSLKAFIGGFFGLFSVLYMISNVEGLSGLNPDYVNSYLLAFIGVIIWCLYSLYSKYKLSVTSAMVAIYCGIGTIICLIFHLACETT